jgi:signal transduction histidine kinase
MKSVAEVFWPGRASVLLISIAGFIGVVLAVSTSVNSWQLSMITASMTTAYTAAAFFALLPLRSRIEKIPSISLPLVFLALLFIGASRGWVFYEIGAVLDLNDKAGLETRIINSTLTIVIWGSIFVLIESRLSWFRKNFRESFSYQALQLARNQDLSTLEIANSIDKMENIQALQANLRGIAEEAKTSKLSSAQLLAAASAIRQEIEIWLRPLSHRIWFDSARGLPKFRIWELLKESLRGLRINWWLTSAVSGSTFYLGALSVLEPGDAAIRSSSFVATFALLLFLLQQFRERIATTTSRGLLVLSAIAVISNLVGDVVTFQLIGVTAFTGNVLLPLFGPLTSFGVLWIAALLGQVKVDWAALETALARNSSQNDTELVQSRLAGFLHNSVQSELSGIALALERTQPNNNLEIQKLISRLEEVATRSIGSDFTQAALSPSIRLQRVIESWQGIATVNCEVPAEVSDDLKLPLAVELIEEAISNGVRHSGAKEIDIAISRLGEDLQVIVTHAAVSQNRGKARLGFLWLDRYSKHHKIDFTSSGKRRLTVVL